MVQQSISAGQVPASSYLDEDSDFDPDSNFDPYSCFDQDPSFDSDTYFDPDMELINQVQWIEEFGTYEQQKYLEFGLIPDDFNFFDFD